MPVYGLDAPRLGRDGASGGGKSVAIRRRMIARLLRHPGAVGVIVQYYNSQDKEYRFPNGSRLVFRHAENREVHSGPSVFVDQLGE
jgi:hypothetical protein